MAIQHSRTARLYNPMLEARIQALAQRMISTAARMGVGAATGGSGDGGGGGNGMAVQASADGTAV